MRCSRCGGSVLINYGVPSCLSCGHRGDNDSDLPVTIENIFRMGLKQIGKPKFTERAIIRYNAIARY